MTPLHTELLHVRWSGHATWINIDEIELPEIPRENHTVYPSCGGLLLYPVTRNEQESLVLCGPTCFNSPAGDPAGNHFATLEAPREEPAVLEERTLRVVTAADVGTTINPEAIEQQLEGGSGQAIGSALYEEVRYDGGDVTNGSFKNYGVPKATELPYDSETIIFELVDTEGSFGAKSVGEIALFPTPPAIAGAIEDALGIECTVIPMTPEPVLEALRYDPELEASRDGVRAATAGPTDTDDG